MLVPFYSLLLCGDQIMWYNSTGIHMEHPFVKYFSDSSKQCNCLYKFLGTEQRTVCQSSVCIRRGLRLESSNKFSEIFLYHGVKSLSALPAFHVALRASQTASPPSIPVTCLLSLVIHCSCHRISRRIRSSYVIQRFCSVRRWKKRHISLLPVGFGCT
jgi:hypothetical protein